MLRFKPALVALLLDARGEALCDDCLARALRAAPADVTRTTGELSASPDFLKDVWRCSGCRRIRPVTRTVLLPHSVPLAR
ncbi:MAG: hypothetical protein HYU41_07760 [Candidatus Rokubacteria bacterium]|nr:hypothetical protein [Candidatus Rokubacteria bacterium]